MSAAVGALTTAPGSGARYRLRRRLGGAQGITGWTVLALLVLAAVLAPALAPYSPTTIDSSRVFTAPGSAHAFGTDDLGRDVLSRVLFAYRASLSIAIGSVLLAMAVGVPLGVVAGYTGGWVDLVLMRCIDLLLAFPALLLAISLIAITGPGNLVALIAIAIIYLPIMARVVRSSVLVVRGEPYVLGARARGASHWAVVTGHVLPNAIGPALVQASMLSAFAILIEAALSFLGLGAQPPAPELGLMLAEGNDYLTQAPWVEIFPGVAIAVSVLAFNLIGDGLRRTFDPQELAR